MTSCHAAARWYVQRGLRVHPLRVGSKLPLLKRWQQRATADLGTVDRWWTRWPTAGVAIATGAGSGVIVLDVDPRHGGDGAVHELERAHGELPQTWRCLTAGGGFHAYFRHPGDRVGNRAGLHDGIDLRGDGGYVVAPPTQLGTGRCYAWEIGYAPHEVALGEAPAWLLGGGPSSHPLGRDGTPLSLAAGSRNATLFRIGAALRRYGIGAPAITDALAAINERHCAPPLAAREITAIATSAARYAPTLSDTSGGPSRTVKVV